MLTGVEVIPILCTHQFAALELDQSQSHSLFTDPKDSKTKHFKYNGRAFAKFAVYFQTGAWIWMAGPDDSLVHF